MAFEMDVVRSVWVAEMDVKRGDSFFGLRWQVFRGLKKEISKILPNSW